MKFGLLVALPMLASYLAPSSRAAAETPRTLTTPVTLDNLDAASFAEWVDGVEKPIRPGDAKPKKPAAAMADGHG